MIDDGLVHGKNDGGKDRYGSALEGGAEVVRGVTDGGGRYGSHSRVDVVGHGHQTSVGLLKSYQRLSSNHA